MGRLDRRGNYLSGGPESQSFHKEEMYREGKGDDVEVEVVNVGSLLRPRNSSRISKGGRNARSAVGKDGKGEGR